MEAPSLHDTEKCTRLKEETSLTEVEKMESSTYLCNEKDYYTLIENMYDDPYHVSSTVG